jgi:hypothetical protein
MFSGKQCEVGTRKRKGKNVGKKMEDEGEIEVKGLNLFKGGINKDSKCWCTARRKYV